MASLVISHPDRISPHEEIGDVSADVPVLMLGGDEEVFARPYEEEVPFDRVRPHGELLMFAVAGHLGMMATDPIRYRGAVLGFIGRASTPAWRSARHG